MVHRGRATKTQTVGKNETKSVEGTTQNGQRQTRREQWGGRRWWEHLVFRKKEFQQNHAVGCTVWKHPTQIAVRSGTHGQTGQRGELHVEGAPTTTREATRDTTRRCQRGFVGIQVYKFYILMNEKISFPFCLFFCILLLLPVVRTPLKSLFDHTHPLMC